MYEKAGNSETDYIFAGGLRVVKVTGNAVRYYHSDHLGSIRLVTDDSANVKVLFTANYQPFGRDNVAPGCQQQGCSEANKFTGKPWSSNSQLYYHFQRWYEPSTGRYLSQDPAGGLNPYPYALNNPIRYVDPDGASPLDVFEKSLLTFGAFAAWGSEAVLRAEVRLGSTVTFRTLPLPWHTEMSRRNVHTLFELYTPKIPTVRPNTLHLKFDLPKPKSRWPVSRGYHIVTESGHHSVPSAFGKISESTLMRTGRAVARGLAILGIGLSLYNIWNAYQLDTANGQGYGNTLSEIMIEGGVWIGSIGGCFLGGVIGGPVGCLAGGMIGGTVGEQVVRTVLGASWQNAPGRNLPIMMSYSSGGVSIQYR